MAKIAWKVIKGYGPYAYLQRTVTTGGKVISKHIAYLGKAGVGGLVPGKYVQVPAVAGFPGGAIRAPLIGHETLRDLKPNPKASVKWMAAQVKDGLPASDITAKPPPEYQPPKAKSKAKTQPKAATKKAYNPKSDKPATAKTDAPPAPAKPKMSASVGAAPKWVKVGEQLGSTPGGFYQDDAGVKHYVKHPVTDNHRKNELLAMALYRLAKVAVPETFATEVEGKPGVASRYIEGLTGSGTNPKDLVGTKEGFAVDAWLANWDVVGVGATKYDNILGLDGHAYRIDAGGALLYRGTGGPKGDLFGEEVTELEGLRDKQLNPVSETVFGDMTLQEIAGSATKVTAIPDSKIAAAVQEHFGDDPALAQELTAKLIARRDSINKQVNDQVMDHLAGQIAASDPATAMLQQKLEAQKPAEPQQLGAADSPPAYPSLVKLDDADILKDKDGKPLVSDTHIKQLTEAMEKGVPALNLVKWELTKEVEGNDQVNAILFGAEMLYKKSAADDALKTATGFILAGPETTLPPGFKPGLNPEQLHHDVEGNPLVTAGQIRQLEEAAAQGKHALADKVNELAAASYSTNALQLYAVLNAAASLHYQMQNPPKQPQPVDAPEEAPASPLLQPKDILKDDGGKPLVTQAQLNSMEAALHKGPVAFYELKEAMYQEAKGSAAKHAIMVAAYNMQENWNAQSLFKLPDIPEDAKGKPLLNNWKVQDLEKAAEVSPFALESEKWRQIAKARSLAQVEAWLQAGNTLHQIGQDAQLPNYNIPQPGVTLTGLDSATIKLDPADIPKGENGKVLLTKLDVTKLELAASVSYGALDQVKKEMVEKTKSPEKTSALNQVFKKLESFKVAQLKADALAKQAPEPPRVVAQAPATPAAPPDPMSYKLTDDEIPTDAKGEPLVSKANVKKLEEAMGKSVADLQQVTSELTKTVKKQDKIKALLDTSDLMYKKWAAATYLKNVTDDLLKAPVQQDTGLKPSLKVLDIDKDGEGNPLLSPDQVQQLEEAAAQGKYALAHKAHELAQEVGYQAGPQFYALMNATDALSGHLHGGVYEPEESEPKPVAPASATVSAPEAAATPGPKLTDAEIPKAMGKPVLSKDQVKVLEDAAAKGIPELEAAADQLVENIPFQASNDAVMNAAAVLKAKLSGVQGSPAGILTVKPKVTEVPKDNKGKPLVSKANIKKLEDAAAQPGQLDVVATGLAEKMLSPAKKAAIAAIAADLKSQLTGVEVQEADGGSGLSDTIEQVDDGEVKLPNQTVPKRAVVDQQMKLTQAGNKDYDKDLEKVSGKKGSNEGGLFKDKQLQTLHYVKWPNSTLRAKNEALAALLYEYAQVPVPTVRLIKFNDQDAVMSDWLEDAAPMTVDAMKQAQDVRRNFVFDAWLANWDVVGMSADNIVKGPGDKAYRIDLGGSLLFRAQGKPRPFDEEVKELVSLRDPGINPKAAQVFAGLTSAELKEGAERLAGITDYQIDDAVDSLDFPKTSADYSQTTYGKAAEDLPKMLKARLKARRDYIVDDILHAEEKKAATLASLADTVNLKPASLDEVLTIADKITWHSPHTNQKWAMVESILEKELGVKNGQSAAKAVKKHYSGWKGTTNSTLGDMLRWAAGEMYSRGAVEQSRLSKFQQFMVGKKHMSATDMNKRQETLTADIKKPTAKRLVEGLDIMREKNEAILRVQNPGKETMTVYRGWKPDQVEYLKLTEAKVGQVINLNDPPLYSWSFTPNVAEGFGHGSIVTKAQVPMDNFLLSDLANAVGKYGGENEVVFKGVPDFKMEVIKKY